MFAVVSQPHLFPPTVLNLALGALVGVVAAVAAYFIFCREKIGYLEYRAILPRAYWVVPLAFVAGYAFLTANVMIAYHAAWVDYARSVAK